MQILSLVCGCVAVVEFVRAGPAESLRVFSEFRSLDPARLLDGEILGERGALMAFQQGICAQTCFAVPMPAAEAAQRLQLWDPAQHDAPNVLAFTALALPCVATDFDNLSLNPNQRAHRWLLDKSFATTAARSDLNLSYGEARQLADCAKTKPDSQGMSGIWAKLLLERALGFQRHGFAGVQPYEAGGKAISPVEVLGTMLREKPEVGREFAQWFERSGVLGNAPAERLTPFHYWGLCEANRRATLAQSMSWRSATTTNFWMRSIT
jgi:hypothetical protein